MQITYHPDAAVELREAAQFYESKLAGLGSGFLDEFDETVSQIADSPVRYAIVRGNIRRCTLRRFPFSVYYRATAEETPTTASTAPSQHKRKASTPLGRLAFRDPGVVC